MPCKAHDIIIAILQRKKFNYANIQTNQNKLTYCEISLNAQKMGVWEKTCEDTPAPHNIAVGCAN